MATITLRTMWLNLASDPSSLQSFPFMNALATSPQQNVTIATYAGGRQRAIRAPGSAQQAAPTIPACTPEQRAWIEDNAGELMCVRDDRARKFYAIYTAPQITEHPYNDECDISLTLSEVTHSEEV